MLRLRLALTVVVAFASFARCAQDTSVCREEISTLKGRTFLVTFSTFDTVHYFEGIIYIGSDSSGSVNITKHIGRSSNTDIRTISPGINEIGISPANLEQTSEGKQTKVLRIESTVNIAVYMAGYYSNVAGTYTVFPERTWSTKYVLPSYTTYNRGFTYNVAIVSNLHQNTSLEIANKKLGYSVKTTLHADESYALVKHYDVSGTVVQSNTPVSLVSENLCAAIPKDLRYCDTMIDSPIPVEYWGSEFIVPPLTPKTGYLVRVFARDINEIVNIVLKNMTHSINQTFSGMYETYLGTDALVIIADKKISVVQYGLNNNYDNIDGDPFMTSVPAIRHYCNDYLIPTPFASDGFINTIAINIRQKHLSGLLLDGQPINLQTATTMVPVQPYDEFRVISLNLTSGNHNLTHPSFDATFSVLLYGRKGDNGFGFYLGYSFQKDRLVCENGGLCRESTTCQCLEGYTGDRCQSDIDECRNSSTCLNGATCINTDGSFKCICSNGWTGKHCETDINECMNSVICRNGATCVNTDGSYTCHCSDGWTGQHCETAIATTTPVSNGNLMCFACEDTMSLSLCETIEQCQTNEICFLEKFALAKSHIHYRSGCKDRQTCSLHNQTSVGLNGDTCLQCCEGSFCNSHGCGDKGFPPKESRGPVCLDCAHVRDPNDCDQTTLCSSDELCYIEELKWGDESLFRLGCRPNHQCAFEARSMTDGSRSFTSRSVPMCRACCHDNFCNRNCTRQNHDNQQVIVG